MTTTTITNNTTVQNGTPDEQFSGTETTYLGEETPTYAYDGDSSASMGTGSTAAERQHALVRFTGLSNIPAFATINSATEHLYATGGFGTFTMDVNNCLRAWSQSLATWEIATTGLDWTTDGGIGSGDITTLAEDSNTIASGNTWFDWTVTNAVQDYVDGLTSNQGFNHPTTNTGSAGFRLFSRPEHSGTDGELPELYVDWTAAAGGPTTGPTTGFGVGSVMSNNGIGKIGLITNDGVGQTGAIIFGFGVGSVIRNQGIGAAGAITNDGIGKTGNI